ncbi:MAG: hypothetical protein E7035_09480, partial [Verrucomicrobiaceae bacterium]|nr:hypothetical protein [Verrucomicrobiaceae bacterium]
SILCASVINSHAESDMIRVEQLQPSKLISWKTWKKTKPMKTEADVDFSKIPQKHPRLFFKDSDIALIKANLEKNAILKAHHERILEIANNSLNAPKLKFKLDGSGKRILGISRAFLLRIAALSYAYKITGDEKYLKAAEKEMLNSASFKSWNPKHYLDTAEMALAISIGLDSLYNDLSQDVKDVLGNAIVEKALKHNTWGFTGRNNWNQVCNAGVVSASIVAFEYNKNLAKSVILRAINANPLAMQAYAPEGVYPEGVGYWEYGTSYQVVLIKVLRETFGTSFDLEKSEGFLKSAKFVVANRSHTELCFNFSDNGTNAPMSHTLFWFANECKDNSILSPIKHLLLKTETWVDHGVTVTSGYPRLAPLFLIDIANINFSDIKDTSQKLYYARGNCSVATVKTFNEPKIFLGVKAGKGNNGHGHLDAGSFVLDIGKYRWVEDIVILPYYEMERRKVAIWNKKPTSPRWKLIRYINQFHSTLSVNDKNHAINALAQIIGVWDSDKKRGVKIDMTKVLGRDVELATRSFKVINEQYLEITDVVKATPNKAVSIKFPLPTKAKVEVVSEKEIHLKFGKEILIVKAEGNVKVVAKIFDKTPKHPKDVELKNYNIAGFEYIVNANEMATIQTTFKLKKESN